MMSGMPIGTCWAFNERWNNKFYYKVASCWLFLLSHTTMHGSMNIKIIFNLRTASFKVYCAIWVRSSNFHHQASPRVSPRESTQLKCPRILPKMPTSTLRLGIFYMPQICDMGPTVLLPLRRKACWGFFRPKNPTASAGCEPANLSTKGQHASSRPPKPLFVVYLVLIQ